MLCLNTKLERYFSTPLLILDIEIGFKYIIIEPYNLHIILFLIRFFLSIIMLIDWWNWQCKGEFGGHFENTL